MVDRNVLIAAEAQGHTLEYVLFWSHIAEGPELGRECLSQWYPSPFEVDGVVYPTAEHYMMASKARLFGDKAMLTAILETPGPRAAKVLGRKVRGFHEGRWRAARVGMVVEGNVAKFGQHEALARYLRSTQGKVLVEASPHDRIWGVGLSARHAYATQPSRWKGLNLLGFALMTVRDRLESS